MIPYDFLIWLTNLFSLFRSHFAPQYYCKCSLPESAPVFSIIGFDSNLVKNAAAVIIPAIEDPERKVEVANIIQERMGENRDVKQTSAGILIDEVRHL